MFGEYFKNSLIKNGLSLTEASKLLGVSRATLSRVVNDKTRLSDTLAMSIEKVFGISSVDLLSKQQQMNPPTTIKKRLIYSPGSADIKASLIEKWYAKYNTIDNLNARTQLAVLIRKLIMSSLNQEFKLIEFPGYDLGEQKGSDGLLFGFKSDYHPFIPKGDSVWEFGVTKNEGGKIRNDFRAYSKGKSVPEKELSNLIYIGVSPHQLGKLKKENLRQELLDKGIFKDVRILDVGNLEEWLASSYSSQVWLANIIGDPSLVSNASTLEEKWNDWRRVKENIELNSIFFEHYVARYIDKIRNWVLSAPNKVISVKSDSFLQGCAFIWSTLQPIEEEPNRISFSLRDRVIYINDSKDLKRLRDSQEEFIIVTDNDEVLSKIHSLKLSSKFHCIAININNSEDIDISYPAKHCFIKAMDQLNVTSSERQKLISQSCYSISVLRYILSDIRLKKNNFNDCLAAIAFIGKWDVNNKFECEVLAELATVSYDSVEKEFNALNVNCPEIPHWHIGNSKGIVSKYHLLHLTSSIVTKSFLDKFFELAKIVLSEEDPLVDIDGFERMIAPIFNKGRNYSSLYRRSICETLCILSIHGNSLLNQPNYGFKEKVDDIVLSILSPFDIDRIKNQINELSWYAEASPEIFLDLLDADLNGKREIYKILEPEKRDFIFNTANRAPVLWALERLAWDEDYAVKSIMILAKLSGVTIEDSIQNKPIESLKSIFRSWNPQTSLNIKRRIECLNKIFRDFPETIGLELCMDQFSSRFAIQNAYPEWRTLSLKVPEDGNNLNIERLKFLNESFRLLISNASESFKILQRLLLNFDNLLISHKIQVLESVHKWILSNKNSFEDFGVIANFLRYRVDSEESISLDHTTFNSLRSTLISELNQGPIAYTNRWLFDSSYVHIPNGFKGNHDEWNQELYKLRIDTINEILENDNIKGLLNFVRASNNSGIIAEAIWNNNSDYNHIMLVIAGYLEKCNNVTKLDRFLIKLLGYHNDEITVELLHIIDKKYNKKRTKKFYQFLLIHLKFCRAVWLHISEVKDESVEKFYWSNIKPDNWMFNDVSKSDLNYLSVKLCTVNRAMSALNFSSSYFDNLTSNTFYKIILSLSNSIDSESYTYRIDDLVKKIYSRDDLSTEQYCRIEFFLLESLQSASYGFPALHLQILKSPSFYVDLIKLLNIENDDDPESTITNISVHRIVSISTFLKEIRIVQHYERTKEWLEFKDWVNSVRELSFEVGLQKECDEKIGYLLTNFIAHEKDGWGLEPIRELIEEIGTDSIISGVYFGMSNSKFMISSVNHDRDQQEIEKIKSLKSKYEIRYPTLSKILNLRIRNKTNYMKQSKEWFMLRQYN